MAVETTIQPARVSTGIWRMRWVVGLLAAFVVLETAAVVSTVGAQRIVSEAIGSCAIRLGRPCEFEESKVIFAELDATDRRQSGFALAALALILATSVFWLRWQHRAHSELRDRVNPALEFTPGKAVGVWFIPFANLVLPYRAVRELWRGSGVRPGVNDWSESRTPTVLRLWWGAWIASFLLSRAAVAVSPGALSPNGPEDYVSTARFLIGSDVCDVAAAALAIVVVRSIQARLEATRPYALVFPDSVPGHVPPRPDLVTVDPSAADVPGVRVLPGTKKGWIVVAACVALSSGAAAAVAVNLPALPVSALSLDPELSIPEVEGVALPSGWQEFRVADRGFSIAIPPRWLHMPEEDVAFSASGPLAGDRMGYLGVVVEALPLGMTLDGYVKANLDHMDTGWELRSREPTALPAGPAVKLRLLHGNRQVVMYVLVEGGSGYVLVFVQPPKAGDEENRLLEIANTFRMLD